MFKNFALPVQTPSLISWHICGRAWKMTMRAWWVWAWPCGCSSSCLCSSLPCGVRPCTVLCPSHPLCVAYIGIVGPPMLPVLAIQVCIPACTIVLPGSQLPCNLPLRYYFFILKTGNNWAHFYRLQSAFSLTSRQFLQAEPWHSMLLCGCAGGPRLCLCCTDL